VIGGSARVPYPYKLRERLRDIRYAIYMASVSKSNHLEEDDDAEEEVCQLLHPKTFLFFFCCSFLYSMISNCFAGATFR